MYFIVNHFVMVCLSLVSDVPLLSLSRLFSDFLHFQQISQELDHPKCKHYHSFQYAIYLLSIVHMVDGSILNGERKM